MSDHFDSQIETHYLRMPSESESGDEQELVRVGEHCL